MMLSCAVIKVSDQINKNSMYLKCNKGCWVSFPQCHHCSSKGTEKNHCRTSV